MLKPDCSSVPSRRRLSRGRREVHLGGAAVSTPLLVVPVSILGQGYTPLGSGRMRIAVSKDGRIWYGTVECSDVARPLEAHEFYFVELPNGEMRQVLTTGVSADWPGTVIRFRGLGEPPSLNTERDHARRMAS